MARTQNTNRISSLPQSCVPVRCAHLHYALGEGKKKTVTINNQRKSTKFISGLDRSINPSTITIALTGMFPLGTV